MSWLLVAGQATCAETLAVKRYKYAAVERCAFTFTIGDTELNRHAHVIHEF